MEYTVPALAKNLELTHGPGNPNFYMSHSVEANQVPSLRLDGQTRTAWT